MADLIARKMWRTLEPIHGMLYFSPESAQAYAEVGLDAVTGYFAMRSAPMGAVGAEVVRATFFNFNPQLIHRGVPACWDKASPAQLCAARVVAADAYFRRTLGAACDSPEMAEAAALARSAAETDLPQEGRPLYAGHASLPWPDAPHLVLWHAVTRLREFRGDGHIAALVTSGVDAVEALVIHAATGEVPRGTLQSTRGWDDGAWEAAQSRLRQRGWLDADGALTEAGRTHRQGVEDLTDDLAAAPWRTLGDERCGRLRELARPFSKAVVAARA